MAIEQVAPETIIAFLIAVVGYLGTAYGAFKARNYKKAAEAGGALLTSILDYFDPAKPEVSTAPAEVAERFGTETVPVVATTGLNVGDITVVGLYSKWIKYEKQNQIPLVAATTGDHISVVLESKRAGSVILGLKIDNTVYDMKGFNARSDLIRPEGSDEHEDKYRYWYVFKVPTTIAPGDHLFSIVEGYDVEDVHYADEVCWYEESQQVPVTVTATQTDNPIVIST